MRLSGKKTEYNTFINAIPSNELLTRGRDVFISPNIKLGTLPASQNLTKYSRGAIEWNVSSIPDYSFALRFFLPDPTQNR